MLLGSIFGIIIAVFVVLAIYLSTNDYSGEVASLSAHETEIVRIVDYAANHDSATQTVQKFSASVKSVANSSVNLLNSVDGGSEIDPKILAEAVDTTADVSLNTAAAANAFEEEFFDLMQTKLTDLASMSENLIDRVESSKRQIFETMASDFKELLAEIST